MGMPPQHQQGATVTVKLFEDVSNTSYEPTTYTKQQSRPQPLADAYARAGVPPRQAQVAMRQRAPVPSGPRYAQPIGLPRPRTAPAHKPRPDSAGYASLATRPSMPARTAAAERAYLTPATADAYALNNAGVGLHAAKQPPNVSVQTNPRLREVEKELLQRQALLRRLMRDPRHGARPAVPGVGAVANHVAAPAGLQRPATADGRHRGAGNLSHRPATAGPPLTPGGSYGTTEMYRHEKVLGKGAFGLVSLVRSVLTGELVAMKTIDRAKLYTENLKKTVEHEIKILKRLRHEKIIGLYEVIETPRAIHLVLEYQDGGNVQQFVKQHKRMAEPTARRLLWQLLDAVEACHACRVCHRDLKLENFVLDKAQASLKLIDFGLSVVWAPGQTLFKSYGTPCYTAPEIIGGKRYLGPQVDVWSLGVSLCTMLTGALPFQAVGASELNRRILRGQFALPEWLSGEAADLVRQMLTLAPERRIEIGAIRRHAWLRPVAEEMAQRMGSLATPLPPPSSMSQASAGGEEEEPEVLDENVVARMAQLGFEPAQVARSVRARAYDHATACYKMLLRRKLDAANGTITVTAAPPVAADGSGKQ